MRGISWDCQSIFWLLKQVLNIKKQTVSSSLNINTYTKYTGGLKMKAKMYFQKAEFKGNSYAEYHTQAFHPGKSRLRFLGSMACCISKFTCPPTLSTVPSSTPFSFSCSLIKTRSATLLKLWSVSLMTKTQRS